MTDLTGIVLAGGYSTRMKTEKAFLHYHGIEQYQYIVNLLDNFCEEIFISCKKQQNFNGKCIHDLPEYDTIGPAAAWFSVFKATQKGFVMIGIDYPFFNFKELQNLIEQRDTSADASVLFHKETGFFEPMLGIYEWSFYERLKTQTDAETVSIQTLLRHSIVKKVLPLNSQAITSIDNPEQYQSALLSLHGK